MTHQLNATLSQWNLLVLSVCETGEGGLLRGGFDFFLPLSLQPLSFENTTNFTKSQNQIENEMFLLQNPKKWEFCFENVPKTHESYKGSHATVRCVAGQVWDVWVKKIVKNVRGRNNPSFFNPKKKK